MKTKNILALFLGLSLAASLAHAQQKKPNVLVIWGDDIGTWNISHNNRGMMGYHTPNIDRIADQGMRFDRAYVGNSICAPARATVLTGKHSHIHGKLDNYTEFDHDQQQFQKILQQNGYQTAMVGKIHLDGKMQGFNY